MSKPTKRVHNPAARLVRRAATWILWSRRNAITTMAVVLAALVAFTAVSMVAGMIGARRATLHAAAVAAAQRATPTPTASPSSTATPTSLHDLATAPTTAPASPTTPTASTTTRPTTATKPAPRATLSPSEAAARTFMSRFCRPRLTPAAWWAGIRPLLTAQARMAYQGTDPSMVPCRAVTGPPVAGTLMLENVIGVRVPTTAGVYGVDLVRASPGGPWSVERAVPPAGR